MCVWLQDSAKPRREDTHRCGQAQQPARGGEAAREVCFPLSVGQKEGLKMILSLKDLSLCCDLNQFHKLLYTSLSYLSVFYLFLSRSKFVSYGGVFEFH